MKKVDGACSLQPVDAMKKADAACSLQPVDAPDAAPTHCFVLLHGYMGMGSNLKEFGRALQERFGADALVVIPRCYALLGTLDGLDVIGGRILAQLRQLVAEHPSLSALSLVGYSMGGLVARFLAGALFAETPAFLGLAPLNFTTLATPHLGMRHSGQGWLFRQVLGNLGGRSGSQMVSADEPLQLLALMADRRSVFHRSLVAFERRSLYANAAGDRTVPFWTGFIATWRNSAPTKPPARGASKHAHVEWESAGDCPKLEVEVTAMGEARGLSWLQFAAVVLLLPVALSLVLSLMLPVWVVILTLGVPLALFTAAVAAGRGDRGGPPLEPALLVLEGGASWSAAALASASAAISMQEWMSLELNRLAWAKCRWTENQ